VIGTTSGTHLRAAFDPFQQGMVPLVTSFVFVVPVARRWTRSLASGERRLLAVGLRPQRRGALDQVLRHSAASNGAA
jgi:hypothetical protein